MEYRNNNPARTDDTALYRILADTSSGTPCGCAGQNAPESANGRRVSDRDRFTMDRSAMEGFMGQNPPMTASQVGQKGDRGTSGCANEQKNVAPLRGFPLAMVYAPEQEWQELYTPEEALSRGTLFPALHYPWYPAACDCGCGREAVR